VFSFLAKKIEALLVVLENIITQDIIYGQRRGTSLSLDANNPDGFWVRVSELCTDRKISGEAATSDISSCTFIKMRRQEAIQ
jgi:hypothetical protein